MHTRPEQFWQRKRRRLLTTMTYLCAPTAVIVACVGLTGSEQDPARTLELTTAEVRLDRFTKSVHMSGEIRTFQPAFVVNNCRYSPLRIVELAPEGTWVEEGDVVCRLDSSSLQDRLNKQMILLIKAKAALATAEVRESIQYLTSDRRTSINAARLALAQEKLATFEFGESVNTLNQLNDSVMMSEDLLDMACDDYAKTEHLTALGYDTTAEYEIAKAKLSSAQTKHDQAEGVLRLTEQFTHPRNLFALQSQLEFAEQEMERTQLLNTRGETTAKITRLEMQRRFSVLQHYVDYLNRSIDSCTMRAPKSGELIYCHQHDEGKHIAVGNYVYYMQDVVRVADRSRMIFSGRVQDTRVYELSPDLPAVIDVLNVSDQQYSGTLTWIAPIPAPLSRFQPDDLYHAVQITLEDNPEQLQLIALGASAHANVLVDDRLEVVQAPTEAIFSDLGGYAAIVQNENGLQLREIELGNSNDIDVEVISGLNPGEHVVINNPQALHKLADRLRETELNDSSNQSLPLP